MATIQNVKINFTALDQATAALDALKKNDILYPITAEVESQAPSATSEQIVTEVFSKVINNAVRLWGSYNPELSTLKDKMITGEELTKKKSDNLNIKTLQNIQDRTNLAFILKLSNFPKQFKETIERNLKATIHDARMSVFAEAVALPQETEVIDFSKLTPTEKLGLYGLSSDFQTLTAKKLNLEGVPLFRVPGFVCTNFDMLEDLNLSGTQLKFLVKPINEIEENMKLPHHLKNLNISNNPDLENINEVTKLFKLEKLDIQGTGIKKLPAELANRTGSLEIVISEDQRNLIPVDYAADKSPLKFTILPSLPKPKPEEKLPSKTPSPNSLGKMVLRWTGIGLVITGFVALAVFVWNKWGKEFVAAMSQPR